MCRSGAARGKFRSLHEATGANPGSGRQEPDQHLRVSELPVRVGSDLRGRQQSGALIVAVVPIAARALRTALKRVVLRETNGRHGSSAAQTNGSRVRL